MNNLFHINYSCAIRRSSYAFDLADQTSDTSMLAFSKMITDLVSMVSLKVQLDSERQTPTQQSAQAIRQEQENVQNYSTPHHRWLLAELSGTGEGGPVHLSLML